MGAFNFIESFFLLSLGITFVLIVLLVYHFKQRLSSMEQKCDTMFDIVQNLVKELKVVKTACQEQSCTRLEPATMMHRMSGYVTKEDEDEDEEDEDEDDVDEDDVDEDDVDEDDEPSFDKVKIINVDVGESIEILETESIGSDTDEPVIELNLEEPIPIVHKIIAPAVDYKKMTVAELKQVVSSQGLATNANKLTKTELLKLLEK